MGPQKFSKMGGGARTDLRFKQFPKSRPGRHASTYLIWDETSLLHRGHFYAEKLAAISLRSQQHPRRQIKCTTKKQLKSRLAQYLLPTLHSHMASAEANKPACGPSQGEISK